MTNFETNPNLFVNRSLFIHAWQFLPENLHTLDTFIQESNVLGYKILNDVLYLHIQTPDKEEVHTYSAQPYEYLVKDPSGWVEVYPEENVNKYWVKFSVFLYAQKNNVLTSTLPPQLCMDCKNFPCDNYEKHLKCKDCVFRDNQQSNFESKSV